MFLAREQFIRMNETENRKLRTSLKVVPFQDEPAITVPSFNNYPRVHCSIEGTVGYEARPIVVNMLDNVIKEISGGGGFTVERLHKSQPSQPSRNANISLAPLRVSQPSCRMRVMAIPGHRHGQSLAHYSIHDHLLT